MYSVQLLGVSMSHASFKTIKNQNSGAKFLSKILKRKNDIANFVFLTYDFFKRIHIHPNCEKTRNIRWDKVILFRNLFSIL